MNPESSLKAALVTGANRGLGLAICRELAARGVFVIATARTDAGVQEAAAALGAHPGRYRCIQLDVRSSSGVATALGQVLEQVENLEILINNAGILPDNTIPGEFTERSALETPLEHFQSAWETNTLGVIRVCQAFVPLLKQSGQGRIVNISSMAAQLSTMESGIPAYRISKVGLNAITRILADELGPQGIRCNSISPGWVKTEMGGASATVEPEAAAREICDLALDPDAPTGAFLRNGETIAW